MFNVFFFLSHVVSWVRCGTVLYHSMIFAVFLTFVSSAFSFSPDFQLNNLSTGLVTINFLLALTDLLNDAILFSLDETSALALFALNSIAHTAGCTSSQ